MFSLIVAGSASGKSEYAEALCCRLDGKRVYVATMHPTDRECLDRIRKHRLRRADMGFVTLEQETNLFSVSLPENANVLVEDLSNLLANELYAPHGGGAVSVLEGIRSLHGQSRHLTVVTNEVFSDGCDYDPDTMAYLRTLANLNRTLAREADNVVEIVCGLANVLKGDGL